MVISGCATVLDGSTTKLKIDSNVEGVEIFLNGGKIGKTPFEGEIPKPSSTSTTFEFKKDGYKDDSLAVGRKFVPITFVSIIFWDLGTTDLATGNAFSYAQDSIYVDMTPLEPTESALEIQQNQAKIRKFILTNYSELTPNIANGEGDYLDALIELSDTENRDEYINTVKTKLNDSKSMVDFAESVSVL